MLGDAYGQVVGMFFQAVREQQPMAVHGDGSQTRSFTHIDDIVDGFYRAGQMDVALDGSSLHGRSFNLGSSEEVSIRSLAEAVNRTVGSMAVDFVLGGGYHGDSQRRLPDTDAAERLLGWSCQRSLQDGLEQVWQAFQAGP